MDLNKTFAVYLGQNNDRSATGFVVESGCFAVLETSATEADTKLRSATEALREILKNKLITTTNELKDLVKQFCQKHTSSSFAIGCFYKEQLITYGLNSVVLLKRQNQLYYASQEGVALTGKLLPDDLLLFCTQNISQLLTSNFIDILNKKEPKQLIEDFKKSYSSDRGALLVVKTSTDGFLFKDPRKSETNFPQTDSQLGSSIKNRFSLSLSINRVLKIFLAARWLRLVVLGLVLLIILVPTIMTTNRFLAKRRVEAFNKRLATLSQEYKQLEKNLQKNPTKAVKQITTLKTELSTLITRYPSQVEQTNQLEQKLNALTNNYGNAQITKEEVFFDLSLISKKATANYLNVTEEYLSLLDNKNKQVYLINIQNKNVREILYKQNLNPKLVTEYNQNTYLFDQKEGIYKEEGGEFKKIVNQDKQWGNVVDMDVFNSNVYLLSQSKDEIFKFTPTQEGYSSKLSYFQSGQSLDLKSIKNMCIDFSIYLLGDKIYKYTAGSLDSFKNPPQLNFQNLTQIYKNPSTNFIYLLDSVNSRVIALNKEGRIIKSIFNPLIKTATHFGVYKDELIIFLRQNKLYKLDNF